jgi:hypothetical protein
MYESFFFGELGRNQKNIGLRNIFPTGSWASGVARKRRLDAKPRMQNSEEIGTYRDQNIPHLNLIYIQ